MLTLWIISIIFPIIFAESMIMPKNLSDQGKVCNPGYICFKPRGSWLFQPQTPSQVNTSFFLYTRFAPKPEQVSFNFLGSFSPKRLTKFIIHGFTDRHTNPWVSDMARALLTHDDMNVIATDWSHGNGFPYGQAVANTPVVATAIVRQLKAMTGVGMKLDQVHLIGHSLGAHIAGYVGQMMRTIERITGLDPASLYFADGKVDERLDATDAAFVDVIHTDSYSSITGMGFGIWMRVGHVDCYPNGGSQQPDCPPHMSNAFWSSLTKETGDDSQNLINRVSCNHMAATSYFTESIITNNPVTAYPCENYEAFQQGQCSSCTDQKTGAHICQTMGYHVNPNGSRGSFYLSTLHANESPLFGTHLLITLSSDGLNSNSAEAHGLVKIKLNDQKEETIFGPGFKLTASASISKMLMVSDSLAAKLNQLTIFYEKSNSIFRLFNNPNSWHFSHVKVLNMNKKTTIFFVPNSKPVNGKNSVVYRVKKD